jgi:hypothetical protein
MFAGVPLQRSPGLDQIYRVLQMLQDPVERSLQRRDLPPQPFHRLRQSRRFLLHPTTFWGRDRVPAIPRFDFFVHLVLLLIRHDGDPGRPRPSHQLICNSG